MSTKVIVIFPYGGYESGSKREEIFWEIVGTCGAVTGDDQPLVVLNRDTDRKSGANAFLGDRRSKGVEIIKTWSVDTCQMWLAGWGHVIDNHSSFDRILQLPGDIDSVADKTQFFNNLKGFAASSDPWEIVVGDFSPGKRFGAKDLIDQYGTYALLANWFPEVSRAILELPLNRPRSEFLNLKIEVLEKLLSFRKFAYEQTLNMLIRSWDLKAQRWRYKLYAPPLGVLEDDSGYRQYRECLDQIERTERMLKLLWRELNEPPQGNSGYQDIIETYHLLDRRSTSIRENARITIRSLLGIGR